MTTHTIGGGLSGQFRGSVTEGVADIGRLQASMHTLRTRANEVGDEIQRGQFGRPVINAARAELRQDDDTVATAEVEIEAL